MDTLFTGTINETYKIFSKKKFIVLAIFSLVVTIAAAILNVLSIQSFGASILKNSSLPVTILNFLSSMLLPLFVIMLTSDLFSGELKENSLAMSLVRPIARGKLYLSKIISVGICTLAFLIGTFLITSIASLFGGKFNDILSEIPTNFITYSSALIPMLLIAIISAFVAQITKSSSLTLVTMIVASILLSAVTMFVPQIVSFLPTTYLSWYQNFSGSIDFTIVLNEFLYILAYGIIFLFAGTYLFQKKDI